jgi:hypothetical protein
MKVFYLQQEEIKVADINDKYKGKHIESSCSVEETGYASRSSSLTDFENIKASQLAKLQAAEDVLSASCFIKLGCKFDKSLACIKFVKFLFDDEEFENYYNISIPKVVISTEDMQKKSEYTVKKNENSNVEEELVNDFLIFLSKCKKDDITLDMLSKVGFYDKDKGSFNKSFLINVLQDEALVGKDIATHFKANVGIFDKVGTIVNDLCSNDNQISQTVISNAPRNLGF